VDRAACIHLEFLLVEYAHFLFNFPEHRRRCTLAALVELGICSY
jgi:hypothetical protein